MESHSEVRKSLRPHGIVNSGCARCYYLGICGGIESEQALFDCFDQCRQKCGNCDNVCPQNLDFACRMREIGGLRFNNLHPIAQNPTALPRYVPMIHHASSREGPLACQTVALDTYKVLGLGKDNRYCARAQSPAHVRELFRLGRECKIILRGVAADRPLEKYWKYRRLHNAPHQLAALGVVMAIGPNFSHFLDVPRTDNLFNRKRQLICLDELCQAGISPVPHLSAAAPGDWRFWRDYLQQNATLRYVAAEFQTGNKARSQGEAVIERVVWLQDEIGRPLHPLVIGGCQFVEQLAEDFEDFTVIDSRPFINTMKRRRCRVEGGKLAWQANVSAPGQGLDSQLDYNIGAYSEWIDSRAGHVARVKSGRFRLKNLRSRSTAGKH